MLTRRSALAALGTLGLAGFVPGAEGAGLRPAPAQPDPRLRAFHMPLEAARHTRTFMQWPVAASVYGRHELERVQQSIIDIANTIAEFEPVVLLGADTSRSGRKSGLSGAVELWDIPTDDLWCRDSGPTFVVDGKGALAIAHLRFNGWGGRQRCVHDSHVAERVAARLQVPLLETGLVGEQGGVDHDGAGLLLAHASCWVNANRNHLGRSEIAHRLCQALGGHEMIWAPGIVGADITDYHIDALARFIGPGKVLIQVDAVMDPTDPWSRAAHQTLACLKRVRGMTGRKLEIVTVPEPEHTRSKAPDFVSSYINYYVCNGAVIAAQFGDSRTDGIVEETLSELYPGRKIRMLNIDPLGESGGGIHCATQQQPMGV
ncbi:agmatine deiminase family protein [Formicincola oecophyllae]|uniref:Agmatine deiminase family protein n=1 Tax=Formicincola oecophyllae TaxID=2558361 RepID=A0A4Y6UDY6_9PROT|nr:agmatine deiminase family protein [Formicincola oecophyllae]QDH14225.1 agmatine deiminase family protein [Formicincola oecophyllae]